MKMETEEGKSLVETPTWAVASVVSVMVLAGFFINAALVHTEKWLYRTKRKALISALDKIKEELMLFAVLSLLMGHWIVYAAKICVKSSAISSHFYPCSVEKSSVESLHHQLPFNNYSNYAISRQLLSHKHSQICPEGSSSFVSKESLEQLHRFLLVLGVTHVSYSFFAIALAMIKIYSWKIWENQAKSLALPRHLPQGMTRLSTFIYRNTAHPWSQHNILVWLLCFSRQIWSSINRTDYKALRLGFITTHNLPLSYDFHNYMLRSMEEEFRDIVGISIPLWIFAISCILLGFHGTNIYFWLSFLPAVFIVLVGTKLHRIVIKLAVETKNTGQSQSQINLRDELFWFGRPRLLLRFIQFISFQNAFEMATCLWSLWEVNETSCFTKNHSFLVIRLIFGVISQIWCSFITFPLYVIVTQMGSRFKKTIVSENVRESLHTWRRRVKAKHKHDSTFTILPTTSSTMSLDSMVDDDHDEPISPLHALLDEGQSKALEVSTDDDNICNLDPVRHDDEDCDEIYSSSESEQFESVSEIL